MFGEPVSHPPASLTNVDFIAKIASTTIDEVMRSARNRDSNVEGVLFVSTEGYDVGDERASVTTG